MLTKYTDDRTPEQREGDILAHRRRIQRALRLLRAAGLDPAKTQAKKCDKILENSY